MTDKEKFKQLFTEVGIEFTENGNLLEVNKFYVDGSSDDVDFVISFYDDEDLKDKFQEFRVYNETVFKNKKKKRLVMRKTKINTNMPEILTIDGISQRAKNCLARNGILTIKDLLTFLENTDKNESPLLKFKNCGVKTSDEIYKYLINNGYIMKK